MMLYDLQHDATSSCSQVFKKLYPNIQLGGYILMVMTEDLTQHRVSSLAHLIRVITMGRGAVVGSMI